MFRIRCNFDLTETAPETLSFGAVYCPPKTIVLVTVSDVTETIVFRALDTGRPARPGPLKTIVSATSETFQEQFLEDGNRARNETSSDGQELSPRAKSDASKFGCGRVSRKIMQAASCVTPHNDTQRTFARTKDRQRTDKGKTKGPHPASAKSHGPGFGGCWVGALCLPFVYSLCNFVGTNTVPDTKHLRYLFRDPKFSLFPELAAYWLHSAQDHPFNLIIRSGHSPEALDLYLEGWDLDDLEIMLECLNVFVSVRSLKVMGPVRGNTKGGLQQLFQGIAQNPSIVRLALCKRCVRIKDKLHTSQEGKSLIVPALETIHINHRQDNIPLSPLVQMLAARTMNAQTGAKLRKITLAFEDDCDNLDSIDPVERDRKVEKTLEQLRELRSQGLEVDVRSSYKWLSKNIGTQMANPSYQ
ncbi:hypothetical protein C8R47DRAFT_1079047 [Mycena vitilis]|nr:hypothetical protein C8R47DRAFT_1079047 [Mycena vitilis]